MPPTDAGEYYWADLVGLEVINTRDQSLGRILGLIDTPANTVLRVGDGDSAERLLPFVAAVVLDVGLEAGGFALNGKWTGDLFKRGATGGGAVCC